MPYIPNQEERYYTSFETDPPRNIGELVYYLTLTVLNYIADNPENKSVGFDLFGDGIKALECAKLEYYRRKMGPHEDIKIQENGDVY